MTKEELIKGLQELPPKEFKKIVQEIEQNRKAILAEGFLRRFRELIREIENEGFIFIDITDDGDSTSYTFNLDNMFIDRLG